MIPEILFEDAHILVCVKPAGIPVQSRKLSEPDMVSILKNYLSRIPAAKKGAPAVGTANSPMDSDKKEPYLAVIHRLDQPVEGILVFAKTQRAAKSLNQQLKSHGFGKHYRALLHSTPTVSEADLNDYLVKNGRTNTSKVCSEDTPGAKAARLHYKIIRTLTSEEGALYSVAEIKLDTGRHHQIRVQMANLGCPIVGDRKYGPPTDGSGTAAEVRKAVSCPLRNPGMNHMGLQLFAYRLQFSHPVTGKTMEFQIPRLTEDSM